LKICISILKFLIFLIEILKCLRLFGLKTWWFWDGPWILCLWLNEIIDKMSSLPTNFIINTHMSKNFDSKNFYGVSRTHLHIFGHHRWLTPNKTSKNLLKIVNLPESQRNKQQFWWNLSVTLSTINTASLSVSKNSRNHLTHILRKSPIPKNFNNLSQLNHNKISI